jgi:DNA helicase-2/ATP-dependent DNA helicase PcrA
LETPWRWINQGTELLGEDLKKIRAELEKNKTRIIDFSPYPKIQCYQFDKDQLFKPYGESDFKKNIYKLLNSNDDILFIHSDSAIRDVRITYINYFPNILFLIESIDQEEFYILSKTIDSFSSNGENTTANIYNLLVKLFPKTEIEKWIQVERLTQKRNVDGTEYVLFREAFEKYKEKNDNIYLARIMEIMTKLIGKKSNYKDIYSSLLYALRKSSENSSTVYSEMVSHRNMVRRVGRKLYGKSIGTTLLTKGLECDTVVLLEETPFDYKNQYVALTRGSKRVVVLQIKNNKQRQKTESSKPQENIDEQLSLW